MVTCFHADDSLALICRTAHRCLDCILGHSPPPRPATPESLEEEQSIVLPPLIIRKSPSFLQSEIHDRESIPSVDSSLNSSEPEKHPIEPSPSPAREPDTKWLDFFDAEVKSPAPPIEPPKIVVTHPSVVRPVIHQKKPLSRTPSVTQYDFEQAVINLHAGKPVTAQSTTTQTPADPFESLFSSKRSRNGDANVMSNERRKDSFYSLLTPKKSTVKLLPLHQTEKLQRPKLVTGTSKPTVNRAFVEEIEEFIL